MAVYMMGDWVAKPGQDEEFVRLWHERVESALTEIDSDGWAVLLRDKDDSHHYTSVAQYSDEEAFIQWRDGDGFKNRMADLIAVLESAETSLFNVVKTAGRPPLAP